MPEETNFWKKVVIEFLEFVKKKVETGNLTMQEWESISRTIESGMDLKGTTEDFARFYGKSKTNITTVIDRKMLPKPERRLLHSFNLFQKAKPKSWDVHYEKADDQ